jgi:hypothetical protein
VLGLFAVATEFEKVAEELSNSVVQAQQRAYSATYLGRPCIVQKIALAEEVHVMYNNLTVHLGILRQLWSRIPRDDWLAVE